MLDIHLNIFKMTALSLGK